MNTLICIDRDGVLIYDKKYHLGKSNNWKKKVKILPKVIEGIKLLKKIPSVKIYMITNQPGVAIKEFKLLDDKRVAQVCEYVLNKLEKKGAKLDGYFACGHATPDYVKKRKKYKFHKSKVCNCFCIKPNLGMVISSLEKEGLNFKKTKIYVIGDRASDVQTAINVKGTGILVPFINEPEQIKKMNKKGYIAKNFLEASKIVYKKNKK